MAGYRFDAAEIDFEEVTVFDIPMLYVECRIDRASIPKGMYMYEVRHTSDDWSEPCQIANAIVVNFAGTLISNRPVRLDADGIVSVDPENDWNYEGAELSLKEYMEQHPPIKKRGHER